MGDSAGSLEVDLFQAPFVGARLSGHSRGDEGHSSKPTDAVLQYRFLVYNCSLVHWSCVRPLLRLGAWSRAVPSLAMMTRALGACADPDVRWRSRHATAVARALDAAGLSRREDSQAWAAHALRLAGMVTDAAADSLVVDARLMAEHASRAEGTEAVNAPGRVAAQ